MSEIYEPRFFREPKENDVKYQITGQVRMLQVALNYEGTKSPLNCTVDADRIRAMAKNSGVTDITVMYDTDYSFYPNKANVAQKLAQKCASCKPGDYMVFTYSGHGTSTADHDGDEIDSKDQALCLRNQSTGNTELLVDDQFARIIAGSIPDGVPFLALIDACRSGTILDITKKNLWGNKMVYCISGCQDNQYSIDTGDGGQMTNALLKGLRTEDSEALRQNRQASLQHVFNRSYFNMPQKPKKSANKKKKGLLSSCMGGNDQPSSSSGLGGMGAMGALGALGAMGGGGGGLGGAMHALSALGGGGQGALGTIANIGVNQLISSGGFGNVFTTGLAHHAMNAVQNYFGDKPGQFAVEHQNVPNQKQQWLNFSWNPTGDPTRVPFPF